MQGIGVRIKERRPEAAHGHLLPQGEKEEGHGCPAAAWLVNAAHGRETEKTTEIEGPPSARAGRSWPGGDCRHAPDGREDPRRLRALWLRASRNPGDGIHRRARKIPAGPGPAERGRVLVPGRRRAVDLAALRFDRALGALRGGKFRRAAEAVSQLSRGLRLPQREAGPRPLPPVHAVRRRYGGVSVAGGRRR